MDEETAPVLHADILRAVSKEGRPYECIEVKLGDVSVGRIFPVRSKWRLSRTLSATPGVSN